MTTGRTRPLEAAGTPSDITDGSRVVGPSRRKGPGGKDPVLWDEDGSVTARPGHPDGGPKVRSLSMNVDGTVLLFAYHEQWVNTPVAPAWNRSAPWHAPERARADAP
ncbi:hypothetical protein [Streptomyces sp. NPDC001678]|uniref:hypothetical protein n=1 Tax=Streptomyces sp. NPDC001678 TaxID=3364599 RepID=UPI0036BA6384